MTSLFLGLTDFSSLEKTQRPNEPTNARTATARESNGECRLPGTALPVLLELFFFEVGCRLIRHINPLPLSETPH